jgi:hypothetical protein
MFNLQGVALKMVVSLDLFGDFYDAPILPKKSEKI